MIRRIFPVIGFLVLFGAIVLIGYLGWASFEHYRLIEGLLGGVIGSILTLLLAYVAWVQLSRISETASADFILRLKKDFFQEETRTLIHLFDSDFLKYTERGKEAFFQVEEARIAGSGLPQDLKERLLKKKVYSAYDVDDLLLGHFEDLGMLCEFSGP